MALIKCIDCGNDVSDSASSCPRCGRPLSALRAGPSAAIRRMATVPREKSPWLAGLLNLFLPGAGFVYLGQPLVVVGGVIVLVIGGAMTIVALQADASGTDLFLSFFLDMGLALVAGGLAVKHNKDSCRFDRLEEDDGFENKNIARACPGLDLQRLEPNHHG